MHPILLTIGDFFIGTYGLMIAIGLLGAIGLAAMRGRGRGYDPDVFFDMAFVAVLSGFVSARVLYIILNFNQFLANPLELILSRTGFVFLGGFVGAIAVLIWWLRRKQLPVLATGDLVAPSVALAHGFGRIGCHLAGCCWGGVCSVTGMGITLEPHLMPDGYPFANAYMDHLEHGLIEPGAAFSLPVWPVQLYEAFGLFALAALLVWVAARKPRRQGLVLGLYVTLYAVMRFALEFLRGDADRGMFLGGVLSTSQIISLLLLPAGIVLLVRARTQPISPRSHPSVAPQQTEQKAEVAAESSGRRRDRKRRR